MSYEQSSNVEYTAHKNITFRHMKIKASVLSSGVKRL